MSRGFSVKVSIDKNWDKKLLSKLNEGLLGVVLAIDARSAALAPRLSGNLIESRNYRKIGELAYSLTYGSTKVPYARRRHFENKKNPQTIGYLTKAGESVVRGDYGKHFRGKIR